MDVRQLTAALAFAVAVGLAAGCGTSDHAAAPASATETAPPVSVAALDGLLLTQAEVVKITGVDSMELLGDPDHDTADDSANVSDSACLFAVSPVQGKVYANSGWIAIRSQIATSLDFEVSAPFVSESIVLFPSAKEAEAFFTASAQRWQACANRRFTKKKSNGSITNWALGPTSNTDGVLSATSTPDSGDKCESVLTVRNNVAVDIQSCGEDPRAANIANQIAEKIPTK